MQSTPSGETHFFYGTIQAPGTSARPAIRHVIAEARVVRIRIIVRVHCVYEKFTRYVTYLGRLADAADHVRDAIEQQVLPLAVENVQNEARRRPRDQRDRSNLRRCVARAFARLVKLEA